MQQKNFLLIAILLLSGCKFFSGSSSYYLADMKYKVPDGTPIFQQGFRDGCENGLYSRANVLYRTKYHQFKYTPDLIDNPEYKFGYGRGYGWCFTLQTAGGHSGGFDAFIYGKGMPFDMGRNSIDKTLNYETGTWNNPLNTNAGGINGIWGTFQNPKGFTAMSSHPLYGTPNSDQLFGW